MADLNDLLARLKTPAASGLPDAQNTSNSQSSATLHHPQPQAGNYLKPFVSSPVTSPPVASPQAHSLNSTVSNFTANGNASAQEHASSDRTASLLNLLKFNKPATGLDASSQESQTLREKSGNRAFSASPFFMPGSAHASAAPGFPTDARQVSLGAPPIGVSETTSRPAGSGNPQDLLLKLLNRTDLTTTKANNTSAAATVELERTQDEDEPVNVLDREVTPARVFGAQDEVDATSFEPPKQISNGSIFTYVNPFEQLAASSPRNKTPKPGAPSVEPANANVAASEDTGSPAPSPLADGRTHVEALLGIGARKRPSETVAHALGQISGHVDKEARHAVARAEGQSFSASGPTVHSEERERDTAQMKSLQEAIHEAAADLKDGWQDQDSKAVLGKVKEKGKHKARATTSERTTDEVAQDTVADSWESADPDGSSTKDETDMGVRVYNFPMRPFVTIDVINLPSPASVVRQDIVMKIASLKKEFDQVDRTLASATTNFIVYAMSKGGGLRIIRQDDGNNKQVFRKAENQIFNLSISAPAASRSSQFAETILATGINGSVYWTTVAVSKPDAFEEEDLDKKGFSFPPLASVDDNTSGAQLKTRAKQSSRHPEFFALGRGKSIHIIWPSLATSSQYINEKTRVVDTEKYLAERCLKIATGKAGKDFTFSEDDTVLVSLDKAGRLKFWDVREHTNPSIIVHPDSYRHVETKTPIMVLATSSPAEKSWATSVQFVDKERPTTKGVALRYLLVGSKQNHSLQLWDLGLGKPVQELNFPHENETDAICSIAYHPKSGIIAVGHPTRNSVFLIHLSAPRYNLGGISQVEYMNRLAAKDSTLARPESTAIMSGIRELSLSSIGQLRSLDITEPLASTDEKGDKSEETVFEAYLMHSRGVTCLNLKRQDLGWDKDGKVLKPIDALAEKVIVLKELQIPQPATEVTDSSEISVAPVVLSDKLEVQQAPTVEAKPSKLEAKDLSKKDQSLLPNGKAATNVGGPSATDSQKPARKAVGIQASNVVENTRATRSKDNAKPKIVDMPAVLSKEVNQGNEAGDPFATVAQHGTVGPPGPALQQAQTSNNQFNPAMLGETISKALANTLADTFGQVLGDQLESLYKRLDEDKRVQEATGAARQDAVLRLVSSTLTDNVEKSLSRIISTNIQQSVLPELTSTTAAAIDRKVSDAISHQLQTTVPREMKSALGAPIMKAMQDPEVLRVISDLVSNKVAGHVDTVFSTTLNKTIVPAFQRLAVETAQKSTAEVERRVTEQLREITIQRQHDGTKIEQLTTLTMELLESVRSMTKTVSESQNEILKLQAQLAERETQSASASRPAALPAVAAAPKDEELELIAGLMSAQKLDEGTIKWLQSPRRSELFDLFFVRYNPAYLRYVDQLITLSVAAAVTDTLDTNLGARLTWLEVALGVTDPQDPVVAENAAKVMDALVQRLSDAYMATAEADPTNPTLGKIHSLVRQAKEIKAIAA